MSFFFHPKLLARSLFHGVFVEGISNIFTRFILEYKIQNIGQMRSLEDGKRNSKNLCSMLYLKGLDKTSKSYKVF